MDPQTRAALQSWFDRLYPAGPGHWPYWKQEPYRTELFVVLRDSLRRGRRVDAGEVWSWLEKEWLPGRDDVDGNDRAVLRELCTAWSEWLFVLDQVEPIRPATDATNRPEA